MHRFKTIQMYGIIGAIPDKSIFISILLFYYAIDYF